MKIISKDNYARDSVADVLICDNVRNEYVGKLMVSAINLDAGDHGSRFYELVDDDYVLWGGMEEFI